MLHLYFKDCMICRRTLQAEFMLSTEVWYDIPPAMLRTATVWVYTFSFVEQNTVIETLQNVTK